MTHPSPLRRTRRSCRPGATCRVGTPGRSRPVARRAMRGSRRRGAPTRAARPAFESRRCHQPLHFRGTHAGEAVELAERAPDDGRARVVVGDRGLGHDGRPHLMRTVGGQRGRGDDGGRLSSGAIGGDGGRLRSGAIAVAAEHEVRRSAEAGDHHDCDDDPHADAPCWRRAGRSGRRRIRHLPIRHRRGRRRGWAAGWRQRRHAAILDTAGLRLRA